MRSISLLSGDSKSQVVALCIYNNLWMAILISVCLATLCILLVKLQLLPVAPAGNGNSLPHAPWALHIGMLSFFLALFSFHHLQALWTRETFFLDKFCVHQGRGLSLLVYIYNVYNMMLLCKIICNTYNKIEIICHGHVSGTIIAGNEGLKQQGVRSFAAFVAESKHMLLLWSPTYFTRLWCHSALEINPKRS